MRGVQAAIERARGLLTEAALNPSLWSEALDAAARACGARAGQLIHLDGDGAIGAHWLTGMPDGFIAESEAFGLANPAINPRLRIGARAALMTPVADQDHVDIEARARSPIYVEIFEPNDVPFNCQAVLLRDSDALVRLSISRTRRQGPLDANAFKAFSALLPHAQAAVRVQAALAAARVSATVDTLDATGAAAFLLDDRGRLAGLSRGGEMLARSGELFRVRGRTLRPARQTDRMAFAAAVARALDGAGSSFEARPTSGGACTIFEIQPLAVERAGLGHGPAVLVIQRPQAAAPKDPLRLQRAFGLTLAEADVALRLADGQSLGLIADSRSVTLGTVRSQMQAIYQKMGVHRQAELVVAVRGLN